MAAKFTIKGMDKCIKALRALPGNTAKRPLRSSTTAAARVLKSSVKDITPVDTGLLKQSIDYKVTGKGLHISAIVGSNLATIDPDGQPAANHLHLVNDGFQHENGQTIAGQHILERGYENAIDGIANKFSSAMAAGIEREAEKLNK